MSAGKLDVPHKGGENGVYFDEHGLKQLMEMTPNHTRIVLDGDDGQVIYAEDRDKVTAEGIDAALRIQAELKQAILWRLETEFLRSINKKPAHPEVGYFDWVMRPDDALDARANLEDAYDGWVARHGDRRADRIYHLQAFRLAVGYVLDRVSSRFGQIMKLVRFGF
jgi:hypothetical protein